MTFEKTSGLIKPLRKKRCREEYMREIEDVPTYGTLYRVQKRLSNILFARYNRDQCDLVIRGTSSNPEEMFLILTRCENNINRNRNWKRIERTGLLNLIRLKRKTTKLANPNILKGLWISGIFKTKDGKTFENISTKIYTDHKPVCPPKPKKEGNGI